MSSPSIPLLNLQAYWSRARDSEILEFKGPCGMKRGLISRRQVKQGGQSGKLPEIDAAVGDESD